MSRPRYTGTWIQTLEGYYVAHVTPEITAWAAERVEYGDAHSPNDHPNIAPADQRARGFAAEAMLAGWLDSRGVAHRWNGGPDPLPDFEIAGLGYGCRASAAQGTGWHGSFRWYVWERDAGRPAWLVVGVDGRDRHHFLGAIRGARLRAEGIHADRGEEWMPGHVAAAPLRWALTAQLTPPDRWLALLAGRKPTSACPDCGRPFPAGYPYPKCLRCELRTWPPSDPAHV